MEKYIITFLLFCGLSTSAQFDTTKFYTSKDYGWKYERIYGTKGLDIPHDTTFSKVGLARKGTAFYIGNGTSWSQITGAGSITINAGVDSVTFRGNTLCQWTSGVSTCYNLDKFHDSTAQNFDGSKLVYFNNGTAVDSVLLPSVTVDSTITIMGNLLGVDTVNKVASKWDLTQVGGGSSVGDSLVTLYATKLDTGNAILKGGQTLTAADWIGSSNNSSLRFRTNGVERVSIDGPWGYLNANYGVTIPIDVPIRFPDDNTSIGYYSGSVTRFKSYLGQWIFENHDNTERARLFGTYNSFVQPTTIGSIATPAPSALLDLTSTNKGLLIPRMTNTQMQAISSPAEGLMTWNSSYQCPMYYATDFGWWSDNANWILSNGVMYREEFIGPISTANGFLQTASIGTGAGIVNTFNPASNRPGNVVLTTGTTATGWAGVGNDFNNSNTLIIGGGTISFEQVVQFPTLSTPTERYSAFVGLSNTSTPPQTRAIAFLYDSAGVNAGSTASPNWQVFTSNASVRSYTTTSIPVVAGQWYKLKAVINAAGTSVDFYIDGTLVKTETTNMPTFNMSYYSILRKSAGTTSRTMITDYLYFKQKFTTPR